MKISEASNYLHPSQRWGIATLRALSHFLLPRNVYLLMAHVHLSGVLNDYRCVPS